MRSANTEQHLCDIMWLRGQRNIAHVERVVTSPMPAESSFNACLMICSIQLNLFRASMEYWDVQAALPVIRRIPGLDQNLGVAVGVRGHMPEQTVTACIEPRIHIAL